MSLWRGVRWPWAGAFAAIALVMAACGGSGVAAGAERSAGGPPRVGQAAPDFALERLDGGRLSLPELRGQVVLLNFWATWCGPCKVEMPVIQQVYDEYRERGLAVVGVDLAEPREDAAAFVQRGGFSWTFVLDSEGTVAQRYNVLGLPTSLFLDRQGVVRQIHVGAFVSVEQLRQKVEGLFSPSSALGTGTERKATAAALP